MEIKGECGALASLKRPLRPFHRSWAGRPCHRGFTAFEALLAAGILAILTAAVSGALMAGRAQSKLARDTLYASMLGHAMMDEVMRLPVTDPLGYTNLGPDPGETRPTFNCVKDYH